MTDELENLAREIEIRFSNGFVTSKQARLEILEMLRTLRFKTRKEDAEKYLTLEELKYLIFARADYLKVKDCDALAEIIYQRQLEKLSAQAILKKDDSEQ